MPSVCLQSLDTTIRDRAPFPYWHVKSSFDLNYKVYIPVAHISSSIDLLAFLLFHVNLVTNISTVGLYVILFTRVFAL